MKISCPKCNATGTIPDHEIPESGRFITCPRCSEGFTVSRPRAGSDDYLVDTCPSCSFSTFGDETFSTCPKCGIAVKIFVERQREAQMLKHNQELLGKKLNNVETAPSHSEATATPVTDFIDNLHPVNLIGWGVAVIAIIFICIGLWDVAGYDSTKIQAQLMERDEKVSGFKVFLQYGLPHWVKLVYGICALAVSLLFMKRLKVALRAMSIMLWATIALVPLSYLIGFVSWVLAPVSHSIGGYLIEVFNILFMNFLLVTPLFLLERFLHDRKITSAVRL